MALKLIALTPLEKAAYSDIIVRDAAAKIGPSRD